MVARNGGEGETKDKNKVAGGCDSVLMLPGESYGWLPCDSPDPQDTRATCVKCLTSLVEPTKGQWEVQAEKVLEIGKL